LKVFIFLLFLTIPMIFRLYLLIILFKSNIKNVGFSYYVRTNMDGIMAQK